MKKWLAAVAVFCFAILLAAQFAHGQATDGVIVGTITDATGAVVPNATVDAENVDTGFRLSTKTNQEGAYRINNAPTGTYTLTVTATGFTTGKLQRVQVELNRTITANVNLQVGAVAETVNVTEAAALVDTTTSQNQTTFGTRQVIDSPLSTIGLGPLNISLLSAGVASSGGTGLGEGPSVGGMRPRNNSFNIEGVDNNRKDVTGSNIRVSNEATQEVTVLLNQFSAEFGHAGGGVFNVNLKRGSNEFHGSLFEYFQNRNLNAVDESNKRQGIFENPRYDENRFGGNLGGPIIRNKLLFFGHFEYNPEGQASAPASAKLSPTAEGYSRLASMSGLSSTNLGVLREYLAPAPTASDTITVAGVPIPVGVLPINYPTYTNFRNFVGSGDYIMSERDQLRLRYVNNKTSGFSLETLPDLPAFNEQRITVGHLASVIHVHTFTPTLTNELRLNYNRYEDAIPVGNFQFPGLDMFPNLTFTDINVNLGPYSQGPQSGTINLYQLVNNVNWMVGRHALKFGFEGRKYIAPTNFIQRVRGDYGYSTLERYLLDLNPDQIAQRNLGGTPFSGNSLSYYSFIQDDWKVRPNFTLNLGLRYEFKGVATGERLQALNATSSVPGLIEFREPKPSYTNFAPRVGFAWSPGDSGRTSIRGGFSMAYDNYPDNFGTLSKAPQLESTIDDSISGDAPNYLKNGGITPSRRPAQLSPEDARAFTSAWTQDQRLPYSLSWSFGVQRGFGNDWTAEVRYVGTRGVRLFTQHRVNIGEAPVNANRTLPTFLTRPSDAEINGLGTTLGDLQEIDAFRPDFAAAGLNGAFIFTVDPRGNSIYHGLQTELTKRFSQNWAFKGAYTWSRAIDDSTADLFSTVLSPRRPQDFQCMRCERSRSFLDRTHRFSFSTTYDATWFRGSNWFARNLIGNWTITPVYMYESPQYVTAQSAIDSNLNLDAAGDRVVINPAGTAGLGSGVTPICRGGGTCANGSANIVGYVADNPNARYIVAGLGVHPNGGRQNLPTAPINNWDLNIRKVFSFTETARFELGATAINVFNHAQYIPGVLSSVESVASDAVDRRFVIPGSPIFGDASQTFASNARTIQIIGRFTF